MIERRSTCNRDCPDACGLVARVEDGVVKELKGDPDHPVTRGFLCFRTSRFLEKQYGPERVRQPLVRKGGRLVPIPMREALDLAAERLLRIRRESGPAAIFHYRSGGSLGLLKCISDRFFEKFGPCTSKTGDICFGAGEEAQVRDLGVSDSNDLFDLLKSRHAILWGKNPFTSNVHLVPVLRQCREAGATITLIDPVRHKGTSLADRYVQPRPGADLELAMGVGRVLLESGQCDPETIAACDGYEAWRAIAMRWDRRKWAEAADVDVAVLEDLAAELADGPTAILVGWGMQRRGNGGTIVRALDALSAVSGNLFRPGGGCSLYFRRRGAFDTRAMIAGEEVAPRLIREPLFAQDVAAAKDPTIRAIWVTAGNPVVMLPDSKAVADVFERTEFTVVVDPLMTDTARRASLVLPAPTLLEDDDLLGAYGHHWLSESRPIVPPPEGVLHEVVLFQELARRVGLEREMEGSIEDWKRRLLAKVADKGVTLERLRQGPVRNPLTGDLRFPDRRVETRNGRVQLLDEVAEPVRGPAGYPLWLFSNSTPESQASQWAGQGFGEHVWVTVHPETAPALKHEGDLVQVESPLGSLTAVLRFDAGQRRDVAIMPKGGHLDRGHCANALIAAKATDIGLGAAYLDCRVRIR
jgi:anaerobic selenocysteine-containing dehydrogenase